jgi:hypothetical protein
MNSLVIETISPLEFVEEKVKSFNKKLSKISSNSEVTYKVIKQYSSTQIIDSEEYRVIRTQLEFQIPNLKVSLGDYYLVGIIEHSNDNLIKEVPGEEVPFKFRESKSYHCDHCKMNLKRNKSIIIKDSAGEFYQLGSDCVKKYLGINPSQELKFIINPENPWEINDEDFYGYYKKSKIVEIEDVIISSVYYIKKNGYNKESIFYKIQNLFFPNPNLTKQEKYEFLSDREKIFSKENSNLYKNYYDFIQKLEDNNYIYNVKKIIQRGFVNFQNSEINYIISSPLGFLKSLKKSENNKDIFNSNEFFGEIGQKYMLELNLYNCNNSSFGWVYNFTDKDNRHYTAFNLNQKQIDFIESEKNSFTCEVEIKSHKDFSGKRFTYIKIKKLIKRK